MAIKEGRNAIGFDIEEKYVEMGNKRTDIIKAQPSLFFLNVRWQKKKRKRMIRQILNWNTDVVLAYNGKALAKKGHLEHKCSTLAPKFHSSTKVEFTTSSPFFANAMLCVRLIFSVDFQ
jgi:hypothetical protein